jgi:hypothetical protein
MRSIVDWLNMDISMSGLTKTDRSIPTSFFLVTLLPFWTTES